MQQEQAVTFQAGDVRLEGLLSLPDGTAERGVVICHPHPLYGGDMENNVVTGLVRGFREAGLATLRFNFRGVGNSTGAHDQGNAETDDVKAAVGCLLGRCPVTTMIVAGYSFGSYVGLRAGADDPRVHKLIGVALPVASRDASFLKSATKPTLLINGTQDSHAPEPQIRALFSALPEPKSLAIVRGADHFFRGLEERVAEPAVEFAMT
jgi:alpha/beta superfamily hydrolase